MRFFLRISIISVFIFACTFMLRSQGRLKDGGAWLSLSVKQKIYKNFSYRLMLRMREAENITSMNSWYTDLGLFYSINPNFNISVNLVYAPSRQEDGYFRRFYQYYCSVNNKFPLNRFWYLSNRIIVQYTSHCLFVDNGYEPYSRTDLREKILVNRIINKRNRLYFGDEIMTTLFADGLDLRRNRLYAGLNHKFTSRLSADLFFVLQSTYNRKMNMDSYILGFTLNYKFRKMVDDD